MHPSIRNFRITATFLIFFLLLGYIGTLPLDVLDIDSSQYAEIAREMVESGDYGKITDNGRKYLDKPILTFWILSFSFHLLGVDNFAYRLPALFFLLLGAWGIFKMVSILYKEEKKAWIATVLYLASPGTFAMVLDPKIDIYLTTFLILTHLFYFLGRFQNPMYFYFMYLSIGLGFVTKGPISLVIPGISMGLDILFRRDWKLLASMKILPGIFIASLLPAFWSYLLYREYSTYGVAFFLWIQSFGRFYKDLYDVALNPFYFYETFLVSFGGPGILLAFYLIQDGWRFFRSEKPLSTLLSAFQKIQTPSGYVFGFWLYLYLFFVSFSRFQLPQYVYWTLPAASIIFAEYISTNSGQKPRLHFLFNALSILILGATFVLEFAFYSDWKSQIYFPLACTGFLAILCFYGNSSIHKAVLYLLGTTAVGFLVLSYQIYPSLLEYQPSRAIATIVREQEPDEKVFYTYRISHSMRSLAFYSERIFRNIYNREEFLKKIVISGKRLVLVSEEHFPEMKKFLGDDLEYKIEGLYPFAKIAVPKIELFQYDKRQRILKNLLLVTVSIKTKSRN